MSYHPLLTALCLLLSAECFFTPSVKDMTHKLRMLYKKKICTLVLIVMLEDNLLLFSLRSLVLLYVCTFCIKHSVTRRNILNRFVPLLCFVYRCRSYAGVYRKDASSVK